MRRGPLGARLFYHLAVGVRELLPSRKIKKKNELEFVKVKFDEKKHLHLKFNYVKILTYLHFYIRRRGYCIIINLIHNIVFATRDIIFTPNHAQ